MTIKSAYHRRSAQLLRKLGWHRHHGTIRRRVYDLASCHHPWWDWGHRLMIIVGQDRGGSWSEPSPPTWWYRLGPPVRQPFSGFPRHPLRTFEVVTDYDTFRSRTEGLNEDRMDEWNAINVNQDGELQLGKRYWGGSFYGLSKWEVAVLRRYLRMWRRLDWWGARSWLYAIGLHAAVYSHKPFCCGARPAREHGGNPHWECRMKRGHTGLHRTGNYVWGQIDGAPIGASYEPSEDR